MARLFLTKRETNFISDITKELIKDVVGHKIYYYPISELKTETHDVYDEATKKIFDHPIEIEALVDTDFDQGTTVDGFGVDRQYVVEVFLHYRDLVDRGIEVSIGDYFTFSDIIYEITDKEIMRNIYGLAEHYDGVKITGTCAREGAIAIAIKGPTDISYTDDDASQHEFVQQRGYSHNKLGETGDKRDLVENGILDEPLTGPKEVSPRGDDTGTGNAFYDEED
jgi:hypothetical protein